MLCLKLLKSCSTGLSFIRNLSAKVLHSNTLAQSQTLNRPQSYVSSAASQINLFIWHSADQAKEHQDWDAAHQAFDISSHPES